MFEFASAMEDTIRAALQELRAQLILVFPHCDVVTNRSRPFRLHYDASTADFGATLDQDQRDNSIRPIVYLIELEAGCIV